MNVLNDRVKEYKETHITIQFLSEDELRIFIETHMPIGVKATRPAKTKFVSPYTSENARKIILDRLVKAFLQFKEGQCSHEFVDKFGFYECQECGLSYDEFLFKQEEQK